MGRDTPLGAAVAIILETEEVVVSTSTCFLYILHFKTTSNFSLPVSRRAVTGVLGEAAVRFSLQRS